MLEYPDTSKRSQVSDCSKSPGAPKTHKQAAVPVKTGSDSCLVHDGQAVRIWGVGQRLLRSTKIISDTA